MSDDTSKLLKACMEYRAMVNKLEAENAALREEMESLKSALEALAVSSMEKEAQP